MPESRGYSALRGPGFFSRTPGAAVLVDELDWPETPVRKASNSRL